jgi:hypothetical protein
MLSTVSGMFLRAVMYAWKDLSGMLAESCQVSLLIGVRSVSESCQVILLRAVR